MTAWHFSPYISTFLSTGYIREERDDSNIHDAQRPPKTEARASVVLNILAPDLLPGFFLGCFFFFFFLQALCEVALSHVNRRNTAGHVSVRLRSKVMKARQPKDRVNGGQVGPLGLAFN